MVRWMASPKLIIAGHSHLGALSGADMVWNKLAGAIDLAPISDHADVFALHGPWPRSDDYWTALKNFAPGNSIVLLWEGNQHNGLFFIEHRERFDFVPRLLQSLPIDRCATIVPEALVRTAFQCLLNPLHGVLDALKSQRPLRLILLGTPPPKRDIPDFREPLSRDLIFYNNPGGMPISDINPISPILRLKLWHVLQDVYREDAENSGAEFIPVPLRQVADAS